MRFHDRFELPREDQHDVSPAWFARQKQHPVERHDPSLRDWLVTEVDALRAFHDAHINADEAALSMTHALSTSPVPALGGYSDDVSALSDLWRVIIAALIEWPSIRAPAIFALLDGIAKVPGSVHNGEAVDEKGEALTWKQFPYFGMIWRESTYLVRLPAGPNLPAVFRRLSLHRTGTENLFEDEGP